LYGEVFGQVQNLRYGSQKGQYFFAVFDVLFKDKWLPYDIVKQLVQENIQPLSVVPILYDGPWDEQIARGLAEGNSVWA